MAPIPDSDFLKLVGLALAVIAWFLNRLIGQMDHQFDEQKSAFKDLNHRLDLFSDAINDLKGRIAALEALQGVGVERRKKRSGS